MTYRPLPSYMTIKESPIDGLGLFTLTLGVTHVWYEEVGSVFRTPLGGFINHSETPNCEIKRFDGTIVSHLFPIRPIKAGEEITLKYTMYSIDE